jgi:quercetin dioxygenase-like cupin family protein
MKAPRKSKAKPRVNQQVKSGNQNPKISRPNGRACCGWQSRRTTAMEIKSTLRAAGAAFAIALAVPAAARERGETVAPHFERAIPNIPGKSLVAVVVDYAPGGASLPHTHAKSAFIFAYVVSGAIESQVNDQPKRVYHAGESWYETPGSSHRVSRNASATEPAKLLAVFVVDTEDKTLTTPAP